MNALTWKELYDKFAAFASIARRQQFYINQIKDMEHSLFDMCPYPRTCKKDKE